MPQRRGDTLHFTFNEFNFEESPNHRLLGPEQCPSYVVSEIDREGASNLQKSNDPFLHCQNAKVKRSTLSEDLAVQLDRRLNGDDKYVGGAPFEAFLPGVGHMPPTRCYFSGRSSVPRTYRLLLQDYPWMHSYVRLYTLVDPSKPNRPKAAPPCSAASCAMSKRGISVGTVLFRNPFTSDKSFHHIGSEAMRNVLRRGDQLTGRKRDDMVSIDGDDVRLVDSYRRYVNALWCFAPAVAHAYFSDESDSKNDAMQRLSMLEEVYRLNTDSRPDYDEEEDEEKAFSDGDDEEDEEKTFPDDDENMDDCDFNDDDVGRQTTMVNTVELERAMMMESPGTMRRIMRQWWARGQNQR